MIATRRSGHPATAGKRRYRRRGDTGLPWRDIPDKGTQKAGISRPPGRRQEDLAMLSRRRLLTVSTAAAAGLAAPFVARAQTAEFSYKYANNLPDTHPMNVRAKEMAAAIKKDTDGRFELQVFPNNQLGSDTDTLSQLRAGGVEFFTLSGLILSTLTPATAINGIGFAFPDYATVWKAMDGELGKYVRAQIAKANLVAMDRIWDNGFREITSSTRPIHTPDDLRDFKIRVPVAPLWTSMFKALGAAPTSINFNEVYASLQTRIVDGQENPLAVIATAKLYEVQKYCSLTNHMWDGFWFLANRAAWEALPQDIRDIVAKHVNAAGEKERDDVARLNGGLRQDLAAKGLAFNQPDPAPFRDKLRQAGFYADWKRKFGEEAWTALEAATGKLG
jgi:tripartite ATP-independent transporter DctP family solute receptor